MQTTKRKSADDKHAPCCLDGFGKKNIKTRN